MSIGLILSNLLILNLWAFPLSIGEGWVLADPKFAKKRPEAESSGSPDTTETPGSEEAAPGDDWAALVGRLPGWVRKPQGIAAGLKAGGCLTAAVVVVGAAAFALYYLFSGQPERIGQVMPRFAYWLPFALLGLITDLPFGLFDWPDRRRRVILRLLLWWFPRVIMMAFVIDPPFLQGLDPTWTALAVLVIDAGLAAILVGLYTVQGHTGMAEV